jgi:hypothetical protein
MDYLKEYFYISDRKVQNYQSQLPTRVAEEVSAEVKASLGFLSTKLTTLPQKESRIHRMQLVADYIEQHYDLGTTTYPNVWVKDTLQVQHVQLHNKEVFLLLGKNENNEVCALIGDAGHILGNQPSESLGASPSYFPSFAEHITSQITTFQKRDAELDLFTNTEGYLTSTSQNFFKARFDGGIAEDELASILNILHKDATGISFSVNFLARHVFQGESNRRPPSKAFTPLYVCIDDIYEECAN